MNESKPAPLLDKDLVSPMTPEALMAENETLRQALERGDIATFSLWLQKGEMANESDPVEHANLLVRAAHIMQSVNETGGAVQLLQRAARLAKGKDADAEAMIVTYLEQLGGEKAVQELADAMKREAQDAIGKRNVEVQRELIALQEYGSESAKKYTPEELKARIAALKKELQDLVNRKAKL